jgi:hypothetical protein
MPAANCGCNCGRIGWLLAGFSFLLTGCGGSGSGTVEGKVTFDGQPVGGGRVTFRSADGKSTVVAKIAADGAYRALDVPCEAMKVTVTPLDKFERIRMQRGTKGKNSGISESQAESLESSTKIPEKYQDPDASGLALTVHSGTNNFPIELSSK